MYPFLPAGCVHEDDDGKKDSDGKIDEDGVDFRVNVVASQRRPCHAKLPGFLIGDHLILEKEWNAVQKREEKNPGGAGAHAPAIHLLEASSSSSTVAAVWLSCRDTSRQSSERISHTHEPKNAIICCP